MAYQSGDEHWMHRHPEMVPRGDDHYKVRKKSVEERFWGKVKKGDGCWEWQGFITDSGYGRFYVNQPGASCMKAVRAHRFSCGLAYGLPPDGVCVLHRCDNRKCVRQDHLFLGSNQENSLDMVAKSRQARGERNASSKLTEDAVREMRAAYDEGSISTVELAVQYGVSQAAAWNVVRRKSWAHVE